MMTTSTKYSILNKTVTVWTDSFFIVMDDTGFLTKLISLTCLFMKNFKGRIKIQNKVKKLFDIM